MPNFDKTGPLGQGEQTGRKAGPCNADNVGKEEIMFGRGCRGGRGAVNRKDCGCGTGQGRGRGKGCGGNRGNRCNNNVTAADGQTA